MTSNSPVCYANIPSGTSGRTHTERYSAVQPAGFGKIGMTIEEAADYTGICRRNSDGVPYKLYCRYGAGDIREESGERGHCHNAGVDGIHADTDVCQSNRSAGEDLAVHLHGHRHGNDDEDDGRR